MPKRTAPRAWLIGRVRSTPPRFVHVVGIPYFVEAEPAPDDRQDHVWLTLEVPPFGRLRASINTFSRLNRDAGHDPRVRLGVIREPDSELPEPSLEVHPGLDYTEIESRANVFYEHYDRDALTELLVRKGRIAVRAEVWGDLYAHHHLGVHQIHCRWASCAVPADLRNRDGMLKLHYPARQGTETFLFKFCGQP